MRDVAEMVQRNPALLVVLMIGVPALTWAAAYARRPSRTRRRVAVGAVGLMAVVAGIAAVEAARVGEGAVWWAPLVVAAAIGALWALLFTRGRRR